MTYEMHQSNLCPLSYYLIDLESGLLEYLSQSQESIARNRQGGFGFTHMLVPEWLKLLFPELQNLNPWSSLIPTSLVAWERRWLGPFYGYVQI